MKALIFVHTVCRLARNKLTANRVVIIGSGLAKRELVKQLVSLHTFDSAFPISILHHPKVADRVEMFVTPDALDP